MNRVARAAAIAAVAIVAALPARAEYWPAQIFLQQPPEAQRFYLTGLLDMWQYVRKEVRPDPTDPLVACSKLGSADELRAKFVDWALRDPGLWRLNTAELLLEAVPEICKK